MSEAWCDSDATSDKSIGQLGGGKETDSDLLDLTFDPTSDTAPSALRQPNLNEAQLHAALQLGFSGKFLPSSVTGGGGGALLAQGSSASNCNKSASSKGPSASMINNTANLNSSSSQLSGSQNQYPLFVDNYSYNLSEQEQEGLLPPLRRPDINQLPPDVLAVLLKSTRFEEILIPAQRRITDFSPTGAAQVTSASVNPQRTTGLEQETSTSGSGATVTPTPSNKSSTPQSNEDSDTSKKTGFSPFAKEFVPMSFQQRNNMNPQQETVDLAYAMSQVHVQGQNESFQGLVEELDGSDCILSTVTDMISQVTKDPASLNRCAKGVVDVLKKHLNDEDTLGIVVTLLVEQMISNPNFCYSGAKILEILRENKIGVGKSSIKPLLLTRMQEEFTHCLNNLDDPSVRERSLGMLRLLSELYMNFSVLPGQSKLQIFALAVLELMQKLLSKDHSLDVLIGWEVENSEFEKVRECFNLVMKELSYLRMITEGLHPTSKSLVDMIFKLRANKWNRGQDEPTPAAPEPSASKIPVYYEIPDSDDDFDEETGIMIDDEPDDVQAAYEEFLKMSSK
ncbi:Polyadenylate-binding protein-interacting protein 1 [Orchesella cincta]|uniref:Polyadenylate-binding protein-interacting protein 1 n=1 Tax=Orchesella cincta TaxID=48709 RepID=A0A1D2NHL4_ORCCI|nr:Polyadenylate-binding protein-interacting protein 1 [Orchesella cincta]